MSESAAPSEDQCNSDASASGLVVFFRKPASVEYDGEASRMMAQFSNVALQASVIAKKALSEEVRSEAIALLDKVAERMDIIEEHIGVLEIHAELILDCMSEGENAFFINESKQSAMTVTSLIKKRCHTIRMQKLVVGHIEQGIMLVQDNENQRLTDCDGALACPIDTPVPRRRKRR